MLTCELAKLVIVAGDRLVADDTEVQRRNAGAAGAVEVAEVPLGVDARRAKDADRVVAIPVPIADHRPVCWRPEDVDGGAGPVGVITEMPLGPRRAVGAEYPRCVVSIAVPVVDNGYVADASENERPVGDPRRVREALVSTGAGGHWPEDAGVSGPRL